MAWKLSFAQDTDKPGVGTVAAVDDDDGTRVARMVDTNDGKDIESFIQEVRDNEAKRNEMRSNALQVVAKIELVLNATPVPEVKRG